MPSNLLDLSLRPGGPPQIVQLAHGFKHGGHGNLAYAVAEADMWTPAVMNVGIKRAIENDLLRVGESLWIV